MFQKTFSFAGTLLLAGAAVLMMPGLSHAQHGGGHGSGGGHFGGGGAHFAGRGGYFSGAHYGAYRGGILHDGARYGGFHYGYGRYRPYYYGGYGYYPYYDESYPYLSSSPMYDSAYSNSYGDAAPDVGYGTASSGPAAAGYQALYPSSTATLQPDTVAHVTVNAPADAQVWFNGTPTVARGAVRQFDSPPLTAGMYSYDVQARWIQNGHEVTETRHVEVTPGSHVEVDFPAQPRTP